MKAMTCFTGFEQGTDSGFANALTRNLDLFRFPNYPYTIIFIGQRPERRSRNEKYQRRFRLSFFRVQRLSRGVF
jgi:hypothetical protein